MSYAVKGNNGATLEMIIDNRFDHFKSLQYPNTYNHVQNMQQYY